ncbi:hypothetical protein G9444_4414 [Rhodococcus erythropolis]|uniref:Uncharacterized protein n=1 Tax=Rhodococcus erythropolis TaxID=1833 RepID=A0A6G9CXN6_RHOER|nr:hypothetical protein G9444_4414 [Rhodococcus erythropolis]
MAAILWTVSSTGAHRMSSAEFSDAFTFLNDFFSNASDLFSALSFFTSLS